MPGKAFPSGQLRTGETQGQSRPAHRECGRISGLCVKGSKAETPGKRLGLGQELQKPCGTFFAGVSSQGTVGQERRKASRVMFPKRKITNLSRRTVVS